MSVPAERLQDFLEQINGGRAGEALAAIDQQLAHEPLHLGLLALRAEALRLSGRNADALQAFQTAAKAGAGPRNWLVAGVLLAQEQQIDEALKCLHRALTEGPDDEQILDTLITTLFNANRHTEGVELARRQLAVSHNPTLISRAALLLQSNDLYEESTEAFKRLLASKPADPAIVGAALVPSRFTCEWEWIEQLQQQIKQFYDLGDFDAPAEYPLTNLTWCADEACNLGVTRAYVHRMVPKASRRISPPPNAPGQRLRVGYLSSDFRNHATMHLFAGVLEAHDRRQVEVFAYDYSSPDISDYRQRFLEAIEHHVPVHTLTDQQAAERIAADRLDILIDMKLYTGAGRSGILAFRPAPLQAAYLGFPGSAANDDFNYIISDRFVTPDTSAPFYTEKFCRLPHSYQCNDRKRAAAVGTTTRSLHGLPEDKVIFGAFNQSYKIERASFAVWMQILRENVNSVLWLLGQSPAAIVNLKRYAAEAGVDRDRLIFAPFAMPQDHLARLPLADAVLDALVCNGHTTTSDALWAGVPVITARGRHFASRVSESLLNAIQLPELVGGDAQDMVRIAGRIASDSSYRESLRARLQASRLTTPLFDTTRFTRNLERAFELMVERSRRALPCDHIDVPDVGPVAAAVEIVTPALSMPMLKRADHCPLCGGDSVTLGFAASDGQAGTHLPLARNIEWLQCCACSHVFTRYHLTERGRSELQRQGQARPHDIGEETLAARRAAWVPAVERAIAAWGGIRKFSARHEKPTWIDVGCGDGTLLMAAADFGFAAVGVESHAVAVEALQRQGANVVHQDFVTLKFEIQPDVLSLCDVLQELSDPKQALLKAAQILPVGAVLVVSTSDIGSSGWRALGAANPYWKQIDNCQLFSRQRLNALLQECAFDVIDFTIPQRQVAQIEFYAMRGASDSKK